MILTFLLIIVACLLLKFAGVAADAHRSTPRRLTEAESHIAFVVFAAAAVTVLLAVVERITYQEGP